MKLVPWILLIVFTAQTLFAAAEGVSEAQGQHEQLNAHPHEHQDNSAHVHHDQESAQEHQHNCHGHFHYSPLMAFNLNVYFPPLKNQFTFRFTESTPFSYNLPKLRPPIFSLV